MGTLGVQRTCFLCAEKRCRIRKWIIDRTRTTISTLLVQYRNETGEAKSRQEWTTWTVCELRLIPTTKFQRARKLPVAHYSVTRHLVTSYFSASFWSAQCNTNNERDPEKEKLGIYCWLFSFIFTIERFQMCDMKYASPLDDSLPDKLVEVLCEVIEAHKVQCITLHGVSSLQICEITYYPWPIPLVARKWIASLIAAEMLYSVKLGMRRKSSNKNQFL